MPISAFNNTNPNTRSNTNINARTGTSTDDTKKTNDVLPGYTPAPASTTMDMDSFMRLLATQLQNQDPSSPMTNSEMMGQLTSMATVQAMNTSMQLSSTQYALGMMGKEVTVASYNSVTKKLEKKEGTITGIDVANMKVYIDSSDEPYGLGNIMNVGKVPEPKPEDPKPEDPKPEQPLPEDPKPDTDPESGASKASRASAMSSPEPYTSGNSDTDNPWDDKREALIYRNQMPADKQAALNASRQPNNRKSVYEAGSSTQNPGPGTTNRTQTTQSGPGGVG